MKAVILAAGEGSRLRPFTHGEPKVMIPVANTPILQFVVEALARNGLRDIVMVVGYKSNAIMSHFEDGRDLGVSVEYVRQDKQLGTAHALSLAAERLDDDFLVIAGDNIVSGEALEEFMKSDGRSMLLTHSDVPSKYGVVTLEGDSVVSIAEKPRSDKGNLISTGIYRLDTEFLKTLDDAMKEGCVGLPSAINRVIPKYPLTGVLCEGVWMDAVYPWDLLKLNSAALQGIAGATGGTVEDGAHVKGAVDIGDGTVVRSGAYIVGPVRVGSGCDIGPGSVIYPSTSIGDNCTIGAHVTIRNSLVMEDVSVGDGSVIDDSVLGRGVKIGVGCALPSAGAVVHIEDETHRIAHIGAMVGEDSSLGPLSSVEPGNLLGWGCRVGTHGRVSRNIDERTVVL